MLQAKNLSYTRQDRALFSKVAFLLQPGHALQITGPNGIGKTTLLRLIAGLLPATTGQVVMATNHICYVGHHKSLHPALSIWQNLKFLHTLLAKTQNSSADIDSALQYFNLQPLKNCKVTTLSAGQQQKVSLAPLCFSTAQLWLLDEPLANLDTQTMDLVLNLCAKHLQQGGMLICATHKIMPLASASILELDKYA